MGIANQSPEWSWYMHDPDGTGISQPRNMNHQSFFKDLMRSLSESSINGVNRVASAKNGCQRLVWMLVLGFCLGGFGYQTLQILRLYYSKPTVVQIEVENDGIVAFPAITFCNKNRVRKSEYCNYMPSKCFGEFQNISLSPEEIDEVVYNLLLEGDSKKKFQLGHSTDMLQDCSFDGYPEVKENECRQMLEHSYDPSFGNCYTIPGKNLKGQLLQAREADFWHVANAFSLLFDVETDEATEMRKSSGVIITVHDGSTLPDMQTDGNLYTAGSTHVAWIKKNSVHLLPYPYKTNCTEIEKLPWQKNYKRNMNSRTCTVGCSQYFQQNKCNYTTRNVSLFYDVLPYDPKKVTEDNRICAETEETRTQVYCRSICGLPCRDIIFDVAVRSRDLTQKRMGYHSLYSSTLKEKTWEEKMKNLVLVKIRFSTLDHKIFRHVPKYDTMELFSYLGGYSGVWLGFSLLTVYEMIEILVSAVRFAFLKRRQTSQYRHLLKTTTKKLPKKKNSHKRKKLLK